MGRKVASVCRITFGSRSGRVWRRGHAPRRHRHGGPFAVIGASNGHVCKGFCTHHEGGAILRYVCVERRATKDIKVDGGCHPPPPPPFPRDTTPAELRAEREPSGASLYCLVVACVFCHHWDLLFFSHRTKAIIPICSFSALLEGTDRHRLGFSYQNKEARKRSKIIVAPILAIARLTCAKHSTLSYSSVAVISLLSERERHPSPPTTSVLASLRC